MNTDLESTAPEQFDSAQNGFLTIGVWNLVYELQIDETPQDAVTRSLIAQRETDW